MISDIEVGATEPELSGNYATDRALWNLSLIMKEIVLNQSSHKAKTLNNQIQLNDPIQANKSYKGEKR